jgi:hypothetical protein
MSQKALRLKLSFKNEGLFCETALKKLAQITQIERQFSNPFSS